MKRLLLLLLLALVFQPARADHITGGELYYSFLGMQGNNFEYNVTVKMFMRCNSGREFNDPAIISIFEKGTNKRVQDVSVPLSRTQTLSLTDPNRCITDPPTVCYEIGFYEFNIALPPSDNGYIVASQFVFRIAGIRNMVPFYNNVGTTYMGEIPGTVIVANGPDNNSAQFVGSDLVVVCAGNSFSYSFAAQDSDGDELRYYFCDAFQGGSFRRNGGGMPATPPPFQSVPYGNDFSGTAPLGPNVQINNKTGLITGVAPAEGIYVVTVCVEEIRDGKVIATQRKDLQIFIASCTIASAALLPAYDLCRETTALQVSNLSTSPLIQQYNWEIKDRSGTILIQNESMDLNHTFSDTGLYQLKLVVNRNGECADSITSLVRVYPGFKPAFDVEGLCTEKPTRFRDATVAAYGAPAAWEWDFGGNRSGTGIEDETLPNPQYIYTTPGERRVILKVTNDNGCVDTTSKLITITDRPPLALPFNDTTICIGDKVQLKATGAGVIRWSPQISMQDADTEIPVVNPASTTTYYTELTKDGCVNKDSVVVRVERGVRLEPMPDTLICLGDTIRLRLSANALTYNWTAVAGMLEPFAKEPRVQTNANTTYEVTGTIGSCSATARINVATVPYPVSNAGPDTAICYGTTALLQGTIIGNSFNWQAPQTLVSPERLQTVARPLATTAYILQVSDNRGCPKTSTDTVIVKVLPPVRAVASNDTVAVLNQPLQLQASGGSVYQWLPTTGLSNGSIANPVAQYSSAEGSIRYLVRVSTPEGCFDTTSVTIKVFATAPTVFIPTAFTPNSDGLNDQLRPVAAGILRINRFAVFNRWGRQVFANASGLGWDGRVNGQLQQSGMYVWMVEATDYQGRVFVQKGTAMLIR